MSKKNNKSTKRKAHEFDLQRENEEAARKATNLAKKQRAGVQKVKKNKGIRIRKGVVVKGVKVVDAESKSKVRSIIAKAKAAKAKSKMDIDNEAAPQVKRSKKSGFSKKHVNKDMMNTQ